MRLIQSLYQPRLGQSLLEYSLMAGLVALVCVGSLNMLAGAVSKGFTAILPAPKMLDKLKTDISRLPADTQTVLDQNDDTNNTQSSDNEALEKYQSITQTTGSLGDEKVMFGYSDQLIAHASKFQDEYPELFNRIVEMGIVGKQMGQYMTTYQTDATGTNEMILGDSSVDYDRAWAAVQESSEYARLSETDRALVSDLAHSSMYLADDVLAAQGQVINAGEIVDNHSNQIITCGQNMQCN